MPNLFQSPIHLISSLEPIEPKKRKILETESSESISYQTNISTSIHSSNSTPTKNLPFRSVGPLQQLLPTYTPVHGSVCWAPTAGPTIISSTPIDHPNDKESNFVKNYKDDANNTPVKVASPMYQLDHSNTVNKFLSINNIDIENIHGADMYISMLLYLKYSVLLYPNSYSIQHSFLDCLAVNMKVSLNYIQTTIIQFTNTNLNREIFIDTTEAFLNVYKDEIENNIISKATYNFLYNHLSLIFKIHIIVFSYRNRIVVLNYCPKTINLQSHEFNEEKTIAIIENNGNFKKLWTMEPCYLLSSVSSANSNTE